jgi:cyclopropane-fatty-acyl-phospholipid synthase
MSSDQPTSNRLTKFTEELQEGVRPEWELYQGTDVQADIERTNVHYEIHPEFFTTLTGGEWNVYSCNLWPRQGMTQTESQEAKLDLMAHYMRLKPGMRILDVGCGWAGPMTYLASHYQVSVVGLTISEPQKAFAEARIARYGVSAKVELCHWKEFDDDKGFDAIYTDEVIVHFFDLLDFFKKAYALLKPGGLMVNKEIHYSRKDYLTALSRGEAFINKIYGLTGNYRTLWEELQMVDEAGFELEWHHQIDIDNYRKTMDSWLANMHEGREHMIAVSSEEIYKNFRIYCKLARAGFNTSVPKMDIVVSRKPDSGKLFG